MLIVYEDGTRAFSENQVSKKQIVSHVPFLQMLQQNVLYRSKRIKQENKKT